MATITNYDTLVQAIKDLTENDGLEFTNYIPTAIDLAEERLFKELDLTELETIASGNLNANTKTITKPSGFEFTEHFLIKISGRNKLLKKKTNSYVQDYWPESTVTGVPKYYADETATSFIIAPTPNINYPYEIRYTSKPTKLNATTNTTNYYTSNCVDILFAACMVEIAKFMKAWSQVQVFEQTFVNARDTFNIQSMRYRRDGGVTPMNSLGGSNTLKHTVNSGA